jgi:hypothetical protein
MIEGREQIEKRSGAREAGEEALEIGRAEPAMADVRK